MAKRDGNFFWVLGAGVLGLLAFGLFSKKSAAAAAVLPTSPPPPPGTLPGPTLQPISVNTAAFSLPTLPGVSAVTAPQLASAASFWQSLTATAAPPSGYINFPDGTQAAAATFGAGNTRMDGLGNTYVSWAGQVFQLGAQDSDGNYPATPMGITAS